MKDRTACGVPKHHREQTTLLALVQGLTRQGHSEDVVANLVLALLEDGRAVLTGNLRGVPPSSLRDGSGVARDGRVGNARRT
jgi:hypothetical protein